MTFRKTAFSRTTLTEQHILFCSFFLLCVTLLSVILFGIVIQNALMLSVIVLSVILLGNILQTLAKFHCDD